MNSEPNNSWNQAFCDLRTDVQPSAALTARVTALAAAADARRAGGRSKQRGRRISAGVLAIAVMIFFAIGAAITGPKIALARTMRAVSLNLLRARGCHLRVKFFYNGRESLSQETWYRDGKWRQDGEANGKKYTVIQANGSFMTYKEGEDHATIQTGIGNFKMPMNLRQLQVEMQKALTSAAATNFGTVIINSRSLQQFAVPTPVQVFPYTNVSPGRTMLWIDLDEMLPVIEEAQVRKNGKWVTLMHSDVDFEHPVLATVFKMPLRGVTQVEDLNRLGFRAGLRFSKPIAKARLGKYVVALRSVEVNRDGDIFIMYTDGSTLAKWNRDVELAKVSDNAGTIYAGTAGGIEPFGYDQDRKKSKGIMVGVETMRGECMVPATSDPKLISGAQLINVVFQCDDGPVLRHAKFTVRVKRTKTLLPSYAADLAVLSLNGGDSTVYKADRALGRDGYFENRHDWNGLLQATDLALRDGVTDTNVYLSRTMAYTELHRWVEAQTTLENARKHDRDGIGEDDISKAETQLKTAEQQKRVGATAR